MDAECFQAGNQLTSSLCIADGIGLNLFLMLRQCKGYDFGKAAQYDNVFIPNQFSNLDNAKAHKKTAEEILNDTEGAVDIVVAGIGTGGTAFGLKKYLPENVKVFGVEPLESPLFTQGTAGSHKIQGIGANFIPDISNYSKLDGIITVKSDDSIYEAKNLARERGIFVGISAGANLQAAKQLAKEFPDKKIIVIVPDGGDRYLSVF